jgi:hypothetical protein
LTPTGALHNSTADKGPLFGVRDWFIADCDRCGKHTRVTPFEASNDWREHGEETGTRCVMCLWVMQRIFKWREWRPEDSKLFIGHPAILDARGVAVRPGYQVADLARLGAEPSVNMVRPGTGKISLPPPPGSHAR